MKIFVFCLLCLIAARIQAEEATPQEALQTVVDNEGKFFQMGQEQGTRAAFLAFLADDSIVFQPRPVNGKEVWKKRPEKGIALMWKPLFAAIARSADLDCAKHGAHRVHAGRGAARSVRSDVCVAGPSG